MLPTRAFLFPPSSSRTLEEGVELNPINSEELVSANTVFKRFGANTVLSGVDFKVRAGEAVGIVGPNGAGKTTLLAALSGSLAVDSGAVRFRGKDVTALDAAQRCRLGIARSHQVPRPFGGMTVFENVLTAAMHGGGFGRDESYERTIDAVTLCGMLGRRIRAVADDPASAELSGVNAGAANAFASGIAMMTVAIAGVFLAMRATVDPYAGPPQLIFAFEAVMIGGAGSLWGTLLGGIALGIAQSLGAQLHTQGFLIAGHVLFLVVLLTRMLLAGRTFKQFFATSK